MNTILTRRHFLISGSAALGACFLPFGLLRRLHDHQLNTNEVLIEGPARVQHTLYASPKDDGWQLALGFPTTELPAAPTWREWLVDQENIDPDNRMQLARWIRDNREEVSSPRRDWLDSEVSAYRWEQYLDGRFAVYESPEAQALHYLTSLKLANGPVIDSQGNTVGTVRYYQGTMPGADWHFVNVEGEIILPALQHRLRELGEDTLIKVIST
jgi:hypothetical protein